VHRFNDKNLAAGLLYLAVGLAFALGARSYKLGSASNMGPGYLPFWIGVILACLGAAIAVAALWRRRPADPVERWDLRRLVLIVGSAALFGLLLRPLGLLVSTAVLVFMASFAGEDFHTRTTIASVILFPPFIAIFFVVILGMSFPIWPSFLD